MVTHTPYRSWCPHCVRGRARAEQHRKNAEEEGTIPTLAIDYAFLGKDEGKETRATDVTVIAGRDSKPNAIFAIPVPQNVVDVHD